MKLFKLQNNGMNMKKLAFFILIIILSTLTFAQSSTPIGLQKIIEHNQKIAEDFTLKISFFIAFIAGMLGILSPCILPFLPAYFSYTFKEKKNITKMTLVFFVGFSLVFVTMGAIAGFVGEQSLLFMQKAWIVTIAGLFLIFLGILSFLGKGFSSIIKVKHKFQNDVPGIFLLGIFFAVGWTACLGPILAGILGIGAILHNIGYSALLLFFYSLGNLTPLFILSIFYDRFNLSQNKFIQGKLFTLAIAGKKYYLHSTNMISGILFILLGTIIIIFKGTGWFNTKDIFNTKQYFYSIQRGLIEWSYANALGIAVFVVFVSVLLIFLLKHKKNEA